MGVAPRIPGGGKLKSLDQYEKVLLWSNDATTAFAGQTVNLGSDKNYGFFYVECSYMYNQTALAPGTSGPAGIATVLPTFSGGNYWYRRATIAAGQAAFTGGQVDTQTGGNGNITVPRRIYGLKGTEIK